MKKITFKDKYGLTDAVLEKTKTQTRRIVSIPKDWDWRDLELNYIGCGDLYRYTVYNNKLDAFCDIYPRYFTGEVVAVAQSYKNAGVRFVPEEDEEFGCHEIPAEMTNGWGNKMFVRSELMPHHIRITNVRCEWLRDISEEDCLCEGICGVLDTDRNVIDGYIYVNSRHIFDRKRDAFAKLIDGVSGKCTWVTNPLVWVYEFELID